MTAALEWAILGLTTPRPLTAMSEEQLKAFWTAVTANEGLQEQLKAAADADAVVAIAKAAGFAISAEELQRAQAELSEEELEGVAGGGFAEGVAGAAAFVVCTTSCFYSLVRPLG